MIKRQLLMLIGLLMATSSTATAEPSKQPIQITKKLKNSQKAQQPRLIHADKIAEDGARDKSASKVWTGGESRKEHKCHVAPAFTLGNPTEKSSTK